eukprot:TRINITY_DN15701_c0_g1_i1.p1 TRINITY_DN15701_c0_g1~~TRINITY_DN15701_c0_g1_i1.p1  ORF type:complete len:249 (-),score=26.41 TRINITY_DN15701_c0_g1_i1:62-727(-)
MAANRISTQNMLAYRNVPLGQLSGKERGDRIEELARAVDAIVHPLMRIEDPVASFGANGRRLSGRIAGYDWQRNDRRIECKSGQLLWSPQEQTWRVGFQAIKIAFEGVRRNGAFDELQLALYSPVGIHMLRHNLTCRMSTTGTFMSSGSSILVRGQKYDVDYVRSLDVILQKLTDGGCSEIAFVEWSCLKDSVTSGGSPQAAVCQTSELDVLSSAPTCPPT